ncbi:phosphodiesterase [Haematococcus lacustris]|uniref:Phosphodiesterase n=1 Tax=Haematococcus lacustris TaxID=44745 RepID=A0A6A0A868_HAELA|nr:phosphodiesterase [Haematococcus lacustris]
MVIMLAQVVRSRWSGAGGQEQVVRSRWSGAGGQEQVVRSRWSGAGGQEQVGAWDAFAMGNYPYASSYISGDPDHPLPAWPMRAACQHMTQGLDPTLQPQLPGRSWQQQQLLWNVT